VDYPILVSANSFADILDLPMVGGVESNGEKKGVALPSFPPKFRTVGGGEKIRSSGGGGGTTSRSSPGITDVRGAKTSGR